MRPVSRRAADERHPERRQPSVPTLSSSANASFEAVAERLLGGTQPHPRVVHASCSACPARRGCRSGSAGSRACRPRTGGCRPTAPTAGRCRCSSSPRRSEIASAISSGDEPDPPWNTKSTGLGPVPCLAAMYSWLSRRIVGRSLHVARLVHAVHVAERGGDREPVADLRQLAEGVSRPPPAWSTGRPGRRRCCRRRPPRHR